MRPVPPLGWSWLENLLGDLRFAARQLRRSPGFAATALLTIAIGIGACTALFSIVNGVLLRPLRFTEPARIVTLVETRPPNQSRIPPAPGAYLDWVAQTTSFQHIAACAGRGFNIRLDGRVVGVPAQAISASFLRVLGLEPVLGRNFLPEEERPGKNRVALISHGAWQAHYAGRADVLNQTILLNDEPFTIVGVLPDRDLVWNGMVFVPLAFSDADRTDYGSHGGFGAIARLKPGITVAHAQADLDRVSESIGRAHPESNLGHGAHVERLLDTLTADVRLQLFVLLGAVGFVLLIACVNVASLLLARASGRLREIGVRAALGASRGRIVRQFLAESLLLCTVGGALGTALAYSSMGAIARFVSAYVPRTQEITLDGNVLALSLGLMVLAGLGVGLLPALQFTRGDLADSLKDAGRGSSAGRKRRRLHAGLVALEIALAMMLLAGTGLLARSLSALQRANQGFNGRDVYTSGIGLGGKKYDNGDKARAYFGALQERIAALPEVATVAWSNGLPSMGVRGLLFHVVGTPEVAVKDAPNTQAYIVSPDYFKALGVPLVRGRDFTPQDRPDSPRVVIINQELARRHFAGVNPIGQRLMIMTMADKPDAIREIVGVVGDTRPSGPQSKLRPQVYEPLAQHALSWLTLIVKARGPAPSLPAAVGDVMKAVDPDLPVRTLRPYEDALAGTWFRQRFSMVLFTVFSAIALVLAAIGIYGVMSYAVGQRTQEIGIRMALGAKARDVLALVFGSGARIVGVGLVLGLTGSAAFAHLLQALLFNTRPTDPLTLSAVAALLALVALMACWIPARRATKVDPIVALRAE
ncbi:MAG TPA: ABC transporter permease [Opitutaceae bacterium]|nr:ABC transporter permease [Opitutaceae bacterium]